MPKLSRDNNSKKLNVSPGNLLFTLYQLTKFEAPSCHSFFQISLFKTLSPYKRGITPQREIIQTSKNMGQLFFDKEPIYEI